MEDKRAFENALATMEIEGFSYSEEERELLQEYVDGKLSKEDLVKIITSK